MAPAATKIPVHQKILNAVAALSKRGNIGVRVPRKKKIATICDLTKETDESYGNSPTLLKNKKKYIIVEKDTIEVTELVSANAEEVEQNGNNAQSLEQAKAKIESSKSKRIMDILSDGRIHTCAEIGAIIDADPTKKTFVNLLSPLKELEYVEYVKNEKGEAALRMTDWMFPFGRPGDE